MKLSIAEQEMFKASMTQIWAIPEPLEPAQADKLNHLDMKDGIYIKISGEVYLITETFTYQERSKKGKVKEEWKEYKCTNVLTQKDIYLEIEEDDEVEIYLTEISGKSLANIGTNEDEVEAVTEREEGSIHTNGKTFAYDDDYDIYMIKKNGKESYCWCIEMEADDGEILCIEGWGASEDDDLDYEACFSQKIPKQSIQFLT
jgi:hypothetical protein